MQLMTRSRTSALLRWCTVFAWMVFIFFLSAQPSLPRLADRFGALQSFAGHFVEFAVLALLLRWSLNGNSMAGTRVATKHVTRWAFVTAVAYAITDEVHQHFVPGRHMDPFDLLMDAAGAAAALWIAGLLAGHRAATSRTDEGRRADLP
jgi:VanZ family protein